MKTTNISTLIHFGKAPVTIFQGEVGSGKANAIMQTVAMNPEAIVIYLSADHWTDYIRDTDIIIRAYQPDTPENLVGLLSVPMTIEGSRIFLEVSDAYENVLSVIAAMVKENPDKEYIFIFNNIPHNNLTSMENLKELVCNNTRIYIETQCTLDVDGDILRTADRVLFKTLNAYVKLLHSKSSIEKERAILGCGEALYISENSEICKICFANVHNSGE